MNVISKSFNTGVSYLSSDIVFLITIFVLFFVYSLYFGKSKIISLILAFYPAQFFYKSLPFLNSLIFLKGDNLILLNKIIIFAVILFIMNIVFGRYVFHDSGFGGNHYFKIVGYSLSGVLLVLLFSYSVVNIDQFHNFSPFLDNLFGSSGHIFWWNLAPLAILMFL